MLLTALLSASLALPAQAEIRLGTIFGSGIAFEGLIQADTNRYDNDVADLDGRRLDGRDRASGLRRAELVLKGKGPGNLAWVAGYDAEAEKFLDNNLKYSFAGGHFLQLGQFKQPNSLEELSSTRHNDFISKATVTNTYAIARRFGIAYGYETRDWGLTASIFGRELTRGLGEGNGYGLRGTWAPLNADGNVLHLGLAHAGHDTPADTFRVRARPNADLAAVRLADTGTLTGTDRVATSSLETMWIRGRFKLQGEVYRSEIARTGPGNRTYASTGAYASALWNLGGETWRYRSGVPSPPSPGDGNRGLWQLGLRYDTLDLDDGQVNGGRMDVWTVGANWYWRANVKLMLNYVSVDSVRNGLADDPDILEARVQLYW